MAKKYRTYEEILLTCNKEFKVTVDMSKHEQYHKATMSCASIPPLFFSLNEKVLLIIYAPYPLNFQVFAVKENTTVNVKWDFGYKGYVAEW